MTEALRLGVHYRRGHILVTVAGEIDIATVGLLRECLAGLARRGVALIIDLDQVTFMDATGLGALVGAARRGVSRRTAPACVWSAPGLSRASWPCWPG